jgi:hypothetical protein
LGRDGANVRGAGGGEASLDGQGEHYLTRASGPGRR